jgi:nucleoside-diphosphate-sugar epimerase
MNLLLGRPTEGISGASILVDDVARLHILALNPNIPAGRYLASTGGKGGRVWTDAFAIVKRNFPNAFGTIFATEGNPTVIPLDVDTSKTEKTFGFTFESFEEQVKSVAGQYLALLEREMKQQS